MESIEITATLSYPYAKIEVVEPSQDNQDAANDGLERQDWGFAEGMLVDDEGTLIKTYSVHLGQAAEHQWPKEMPVMVKGSPRRFAIEHCGSIRLSKPDVFRNQGETLISDLGEGVTRREESSETVRVDDPVELALAVGVSDEMNRGAEAIGSTRRHAVNSTKTTNKKSAKTTHTYGENGWIWCAAVEPGNDRQRNAWLQSLGDDYDCVTVIKSPRQFARHLAMMAAQQLGPRGSTATYTHPFTSHQTEHPSMTVFHGAVAYVDDPHAYVSGAANDFERMLRAVFFKHTAYVRQREYRFVVWTAAEPQEVTVDLHATPEMLAQLRSGSIGHDAASPNPCAVQPIIDSGPAVPAQSRAHSEISLNEQGTDADRQQST